VVAAVLVAFRVDESPGCSQEPRRETWSRQSDRDLELAHRLLLGLAGRDAERTVRFSIVVVTVKSASGETSLTDLLDALLADWIIGGSWDWLPGQVQRRMEPVDARRYRSEAPWRGSARLDDVD